MRRTSGLFGGVFHVLARHQDRYDIELTELSRPFIGRLKLRSSYRSRATRVNFENHYDDLEVLEILCESYSWMDVSGLRVRRLIFGLNRN